MNFNFIYKKLFIIFFRNFYLIISELQDANFPLIENWNFSYDYIILILLIVASIIFYIIRWIFITFFLWYTTD